MIGETVFTKSSGCTFAEQHWDVGVQKRRKPNVVFDVHASIDIVFVVVSDHFSELNVDAVVFGKSLGGLIDFCQGRVNRVSFQEIATFCNSQTSSIGQSNVHTLDVMRVLIHVCVCATCSRTMTPPNKHSRCGRSSVPCIHSHVWEPHVPGDSDDCLQ